VANRASSTARKFSWNNYEKGQIMEMGRERDIRRKKHYGMRCSTCLIKAGSVSFDEFQEIAAETVLYAALRRE
jgi:hypothetical protein